MSQYINELSQRIYQPNLQYTMQQNNYYVVQTQRSSGIRQPSLNRNSNISSSMVIKPGKIQQNSGVKLKRQNSLKNCFQFKENDPYLKNSNINNKIHPQFRQSTDYSSQYDTKNTYCNPLIVKRDKIMKDIGNLKPKNYNQYRQICSEQNKNDAHVNQNIRKAQYQQLSQRLIKIQSMMKDNSEKLTDHTNKIEKLQQYYQMQTSKGEHSRRHSRSISTASSSSPNFKQLSDIIRLIEQTKNYQMKNSQEYRKMIQEFRSTILQFRDQLNKTTKKEELDSQIIKIKQLISHNSTQTQGSHLRKSSSQFMNNSEILKKQKQIENIQNQITNLRQKYEKLQQSNTSIKADLVKLSVRDKISLENVQTTISQIDRKVQKIINQHSLIMDERRIFDQLSFKKGTKYEGNAICFSVSNQLWSVHNQIQKGSFNNYRLYHSVIENNPNKKSQKSEQSLNDAREQHLMRINEKIYYIDKQGYLLDKDSYYLLNDKNEQIRLSQKQIQVLKRLNVMA